MSRLFRDCVAFLVILASITTGSVRAQIPVPTIDPELPPQDINPPRREPPLPETPPEAPPPLEELQPSTKQREEYICSLKSYDPVSLPPISPPSKLPSLLEVRNFQFRHNTAFTSEQLAAKLANSKEFKEELEKTPAGLRTTEPISWSRLLQIASEIASVYAEEGYQTSGAIISIPTSTPRLTDNGFVASAEVRLPVLTVPEWQGVLQLIPFVDYGIGWNSAGVSDPDNQNLPSVGLGLQWQQGDNFIARFDWGIPLVDIDSRDRTWQENGLLFSVQWNLF